MTGDYEFLTSVMKTLKSYRDRDYHGRSSVLNSTKGLVWLPIIVSATGGTLQHFAKLARREIGFQLHNAYDNYVKLTEAHVTSLA